jgi:hypothetical protein
VQHWTAYLALEPGNAKALLARARAYIGRGEVKPGAADAPAACTAGVQVDDDGALGPGLASP